MKTNYLLIGIVMLLAACDWANSSSGQPASASAVPRQEVVDCSGRDEVCVIENGHMVVRKLDATDAEFTVQGCSQTDGIPPAPPIFDAAIAAIRAYTQNPKLELTPFKTKCSTLTTWYCSDEYCWAVANATNQILVKQKRTQ